jgi:predicted XRE-type DNA-binding protein
MVAESSKCEDIRTGVYDFNPVKDRGNTRQISGSFAGHGLDGVSDFTPAEHRRWNKNLARLVNRHAGNGSDNEAQRMCFRTNEGHYSKKTIAMAKDIDAAKWSQAEIAREHGVSQARVSQIKNGFMRTRAWERIKNEA